MSLPEPGTLEAALEAILGGVRSVEPLESGTTGSIYLVETAAGQFAAKVFASDSHALLGPRQQFELLEALAGTGIAPKPLGFDPDARALVTEYLGAATAVTPESLRHSDTIADLARCLRVLHGVSAKIPRFDPLADGERYVAAVGGPGTLSGRDRAHFDELIELANAVERGVAVLCHNDLVASNLLFDRGFRLIDFDYAVLAPPEIDLASVAVMNDFSEREASSLLDAYFDGAGPLSTAEFARVQRLVRLTAHFWSLASAKSGADIVGQYRIRHD